MPIRLILAALAATALLAACGGAPQKPSADRQAAARKAMLAYAACMRSHGVPMEDPKFNGDGGVTLSSGGPGSKDVSPQTQRTAQQACEHFMREVKPPGGNSPAQQAEFRKAALANSRCMRSHGVPNFPDPQFGDNGEVRLKLSKGSGINPRSPAFQRAQRACAKYMPKRVVGG
jgi:hypothetical protein